jgi:hypothetical protein
MRTSAHHDTKPLYTEDGQFYGIFLAADYTAEHESGIKGIARDFGFKDFPEYFSEAKVTGDFPALLEKSFSSTETIYPPEGKVKKLKSKHKLICSGSDAGDDIDWIKSLTRRYAEETLITGAYDERSFAICGHTPEGIALIDEMIEAFKNKDVSIWNSGSLNPFGHGGLSFGITSRIPEKGIRFYDKSREEARDLVARAEATGIEEKIVAAYGKQYALSPGAVLKSTVRGEIKTNHDVMFWLNPRDQKNHNHGWYTVEDLEDWIKGKGPVIKSKETVA